MKKKVATITFNPAYDLMGYCQNITKNEINRVKTLGLHPAGKGINVARIVRALGAEVTVSGFLGEENQDGFLKLFEQEGIVNRFHTVNGRTRINVKLTEHSGEVTDFNFSGFTITEADWGAFSEASLRWGSQFDIVSVNGSLPEGISLVALTDWLIKLRYQCSHVVFDSSGEALKAGIAAIPWLIKPNLHELETLMKRSFSSIRDIVAVGRELCAQGISHVVISMGEQGALWITGSKARLAEPPHCKIVSTVGAGDAMVGGLIHGLLSHQSDDHILTLATAISALTVSQPDVSIKDSTLLPHMMEQIKLKIIN